MINKPFYHHSFPIVGPFMPFTPVQGFWRYQNLGIYEFIVNLPIIKHVHGRSRSLSVSLKVLFFDEIGVDGCFE